jgi:PTK7 protein tyrosine kinase 7
MSLLQLGQYCNILIISVFNFQVLKNGTLYVSQIFVEDRGRYGCTAGNSGGFEREEIFLEVASKSN